MHGQRKNKKEVTGDTEILKVFHIKIKRIRSPVIYKLKGCIKKRKAIPSVCISLDQIAACGGQIVDAENVVTV